ncbi:MAG: hypothetical protein E6I93_04795 [Chloroflexi bacterium]|nr:MAG: hypothetical protein E6I93_04795 [Chloroflexota bacterium]
MTLVGQFCECGKSRQCSLEVPACLLETGKRCIPECDNFSIDSQGSPGQVHSLRKMLLSLVQLIPFAQQVAHAEVVVRTVDQGLESLPSWCHLHRLLIGVSARAQPALQHLLPSSEEIIPN